MLIRLKGLMFFVLLVAPESLAALLLGALMEGVYRIFVRFDLLSGGMEFFSLGAGLGLFCILLTWNVVVFFWKRGRGDS
ncbi:hypothetical protein [Congregibacter litoralis]|uniref:Uncharacterized protein n=1 Tax=Congregibacter litoralis KT71 TaxID=314285 RepID=V7HVD9_9GAMM|nr:hypothetical protein [Congregibacter litoralis]ESZ89320.1 hypothetical protein KT71_001384 [Congregibacter litoralis KT71]